MLTSRQRRVWSMRCAGYPIKQIALHVGISEAMAKWMLKKVKEKLPLTYWNQD